jgi:hypothetical protein
MEDDDKKKKKLQNTLKRWNDCSNDDGGARSG